MENISIESSLQYSGPPPPYFQLMQEGSQDALSVTIELQPLTDQAIRDSGPRSLEDILGNHGQLICRLTIEDSTMSGAVAQVCTPAGEVLMYVWLTSEATVGGNDGLASVSFTDARGNALFKCTDNERITVGSTDEIFGYVKKNERGVPSELQGNKANPVKISDSGYNFQYVSNSFVIARIGYRKISRDGKDEVKLLFSTSLDSGTKVMLIASSYFLSVVAPVGLRSSVGAEWPYPEVKASMTRTLLLLCFIILIIIGMIFIVCWLCGPDRIGRM